MAPWVADASEVGLLHSGGMRPRKQINTALIKMAVMTTNVIPINSKYAENLRAANNEKSQYHCRKAGNHITCRFQRNITT